MTVFLICNYHEKKQITRKAFAPQLTALAPIKKLNTKGDEINGFTTRFLDVPNSTWNAHRYLQKNAIKAKETAIKAVKTAVQGELSFQSEVSTASFLLLLSLDF